MRKYEKVGFRSDKSKRSPLIISPAIQYFNKSHPILYGHMSDFCIGSPTGGDRHCCVSKLKQVRPFRNPTVSLGPWFKNHSLRIIYIIILTMIQIK